MTPLPRVGETVWDALHQRVGEVMGYCGPYAQLRPLGGGREWDVPEDRLVELSASERLHARLDDVNARRTQGR